MKIVADTMLWVSYCTLKDGFRHKIIERAKRQRVRFFISEYILGELTETLVEDLARTRRYAFLARHAVLRIAKITELPPTFRRFVPGDPNDDPIIQTAISAKVDFLVTADKKILQVGKVNDIEIITLAQFEKQLRPIE